MRSWAELFPEGRVIYYEGDDPEGFVAEMERKFGFDPSRDPRWGETVPVEGEPDIVSFGFWCPSEHMDAVYGGPYPMGS